MDIISPKVRSRGAGCAALLALLPVCAPTARAQGPSPETAASLFPGGALVSYNSVFATRSVFASSAGNMPSTARPTFSHEGLCNFTWGFHRDFALTVLVPVVTNRFDMNTPTARSSVGGTGLGDVTLLVKYRFYRRDSERGTTQASVTFGPKLPTGTTSLTDANGSLLPAGLQPGSGSTDFFVAANWTYTGLFNFRRLVADEDFHARLRSRGTQATRLGDDLDLVQPICFSPQTGRIPDYSTSNDSLLMRISMQSCVHRARRKLNSAQIRRRAFGCRTGPISRRAWLMNGS